jgi:hypothetical protein
VPGESGNVSSGVTHIGTFGSSALMHVDPDAPRPDEPLVFAGVALQFVRENARNAWDDVRHVPDLYIRDGPPEGPLLGDVDLDGDVDGTDRSALAEMVASQPDGIADDEELTRYDVTADRRLDASDLGLMDALIRSRAAG